MARIEVTMPKMGESIMEGTVVEWAKKIGDSVEQDETLLEIGTDKLDSEVPAPEAGILVEILVEEGETIEVGEPIAILETDPEAAGSAAEEEPEKPSAEEETSGVEAEETTSEAEEETSAERRGTGNGKADRERVDESVRSEEGSDEDEDQTASQNGLEQLQQDYDRSGDGKGKPEDRKEEAEPASVSKGETPPQRKGSDGRFYSPLVRAIAKEEGLSQEELESIEGSGNHGRLTKQDVLDYVKSGRRPAAAATETRTGKVPSSEAKGGEASEIDAGEIDPGRPQQNEEIIKMDRMRKVISEHMIRSKQTSAHVTTFAEADVTRLVQFRDKNKEKFRKEHGFKLTFTPFFIEATIQALREFPLLNSSVEGDKIILKRDINYGIAVALGEAGKGGLIVPVIKNAGELNAQGLARATHELAMKARNKQLSPDDLSGGTFTFTNYGSVGNLKGTPIINQPQVAIFGSGTIQKRPVVIEVEGSDTIAIRHMVYLSMSYDHRIIDGAMGGAFVQRVKHLLENFDVNRSL